MNTIIAAVALGAVLLSGLPVARGGRQPALETGTVVEYHCIDYSMDTFSGRYQCGLDVDAGTTTLGLVGRTNNYPFILHIRDIVRFYRDKNSVIVVDDAGINHRFELTAETHKGNVVTTMR